MIHVSNDLGLEVWKSPKTKKLKGHIVKNVKASVPMTVICSNLKDPLKLGALTCTRATGRAPGAQ